MNGVHPEQPVPQLDSASERSLLQSFEVREKLQFPAEFVESAFLHDQVFYILPRKLLDIIAKEAQSLTTNEELWELEIAMSEFCEARGFVGVSNGHGLTYRFLRASEPLAITVDDVDQLGWKEYLQEESLAQFNQQGSRRLQWSHNVARAYSGWLSSNLQFISERDALPNQELRTVSLMPNWDADASGERLPEPWSSFLVKWRLLGMAGPSLPVPMQPMLGGQFPLTIFSQLMAAGRVINLPDTYPIPSRDELREILEDAIRESKPPEHLQDWIEIVRNDNAAKNQIDRYSRLFEFRHYWEVLYLRLHGSLFRQQERLRRAMAVYFGVSEDTIKRDLQFLRERLNTNWPVIGDFKPQT